MIRAITVVAALLLAAVTARADFGSAEPMPAATLLLPYFEVDLDDPNGGDTVFKVFSKNARATAVHVTLWTDWAVPTVGFDLVLDEGGSQEVFLRDVFSGRIPKADPALLAPAAVTQGIFFSDCTAPLLGETVTTHIRASHTGKPSARYGNRCAGIDHGDNVARGFATIDTVVNCAGDLLPTDPLYFGGKGLVSTANNLWGYYALTTRAQGGAAGEMLVAIEADSGVTGATFYSELADSGGHDKRERISFAWGGGFIGGEGPSTDVVVWRDPLQKGSPVACGNVPPAFPLPPADVSLSDVDGNTINLGGFSPFPAATNRTTIGSAEFPTLYDSGYVRIEITGNTELAVPSGFFVPLLPQGHVTILQHDGSGRSSAHRASDLRVFE